MVMNDITHIDIQVIRNLLLSRLNEGQDLMKSDTPNTAWKKTERLFQNKCMIALQAINEAIAIKEGKINEVSNNQTASEGNKGSKQSSIQNSKG